MANSTAHLLIFPATLLVLLILTLLLPFTLSAPAVVPSYRINQAGLIPLDPLTKRQASSPSASRPQRCENDPVPTLSGRFYYANCSDESRALLDSNCKQWGGISLSDSDGGSSSSNKPNSACRDEARTFRKLCQAVCTASDSNQTQCLKYCTRNWRNWDRQICSYFPSVSQDNTTSSNEGEEGADQPSSNRTRCYQAAVRELWNCQTICTEWAPSSSSSAPASTETSTDNDET